MGLDMYLYLSSKKNNGEIYLTDEEIEKQDKEEKKEPPRIYVNGNPIYGKSWHKPDVWEVAYWCKANQIHSWFVRECQGGVDDCREQVVPREKIVELRDLCRRVLRTRNHELLAPRGGFFFGSIDIDERYWRNLEETVVMLNRALDVVPGMAYDFVYSSGW